ncbi:MAG: hypothetical protein U9Q29_01530 [Campylobacterota bacterium]|nr:hypothetical protein [Campylobacterota bacterium]
MKKIVILSLLATLLLAQNPNVYSVLGDVIYDNVGKIEKLKGMYEYNSMDDKIEEYIAKVRLTKKMGLAIEAGDKSLDKNLYLQKLRKLSKTNDFFVREIYKSFRLSIAKEDSWFLSQIINSGLLDTDKYKSDIIEYYMAHCDVMDSQGVIQVYLDEDTKLKALEEKKRTSSKVVTKEMLQKAKIKRLRENDKLKQEAIKKSLEKEVADKKVKIREEQIKELKAN